MSRRLLAQPVFAMLQAMTSLALSVGARGGRVVALSADGGICSHRPLGVLLGVRMPTADALAVLLDDAHVTDLQTLPVPDGDCRMFEGHGITVAGPTRITMAVFNDEPTTTHDDTTASHDVGWMGEGT